MANKNLLINGITLFSVNTLKIPTSGGGSAYFTETSDSNATKQDIALGKTAYVNGQKITGEASVVNPFPQGKMLSGSFTPDQDIYQPDAYETSVNNDIEVTRRPDFVLVFAKPRINEMGYLDFIAGFHSQQSNELEVSTHLFETTADVFEPDSVVYIAPNWGTGKIDVHISSQNVSLKEGATYHWVAFWID